MAGIASHRRPHKPTFLGSVGDLVADGSGHNVLVMCLAVVIGFCLFLLKKRHIGDPAVLLLSTIFFPSVITQLVLLASGAERSICIVWPLWPTNRRPV